MHRFASAAMVALAVITPATVAAQTYPSKPIRIVLPYVPGGIIDNVGRHLAQRMTEIWGSR